MSHPRIIVFTTAYLPLIGGAEVAIREIARRLPQYEWVVLTARLEKPLSRYEVVDGVAVYRLGWGIPRLDKIALPLLSFLAARRIISQYSDRKSAAEDRLRSSVHTHPVLWSMMLSYGAIGALFVKLWCPAARLVLTLQEGDTEHHIQRRLRLIGPLRGLLFRRVDIVTAISCYLAEFARTLGYYGRLVIVPNGVDTQAFNPEHALIDRNVVRKSLGMSAETRVVITVSRLAEKNGVEDLIQAIKILARVWPPERLNAIIIGDGPLRARIEELVERLELIDYVHVLGSIPNEQLVSYLAIADVFVRPSYSEGLGISFLEAMAAGVPIVGTPVGGIPDFLTDRQTGVFCRPGDAQSIADAVTHILEDDALRARLIETAYHTIKTRYEWDIVIEKMAQAFK